MLCRDPGAPDANAPQTWAKLAYVGAGGEPEEGSENNKKFENRTAVAVSAVHKADVAVWRMKLLLR